MSVTKHKLSKLYHPFKVWMFLSFLMTSHPSFSCEYSFFDDGNLWKQSLVSFTEKHFDAAISPEPFSLTIQGEPSFYMFTPLTSHQNFGLFIPSELYNDYYQLMCEVNEKPQKLLRELQKNWDVVFHPNSNQRQDSNIFSLRLVHNKKPNLIIFLGAYNEMK